MPTASLVSLSDGQVRTRFERLTTFLDHWGDVEAFDLGRNQPVRLLEFRLSGPGAELAPEIQGLYREYYRREVRGDWAIAKYTYEYLDLLRGWRLGYHLHSLSGTERVPHAHCERADTIPETERSGHLRAHEFDLREAHQEFIRLWAAGTAPDCSRFLPLAIQR